MEREEVAVEGESEIHQADQDCRSPSNKVRLLRVAGRNSEHPSSCHQLGPPLHHMLSKHENRANVEKAPPAVLEQLHLELVDVADRGGALKLRSRPVLREERPHPLGAIEVPGVRLAKAELLQMHNAECQQQNSGPDQRHLFRLSLEQLQCLELPCTAQCNSDVQRSPHQDVQLNEIQRHIKQVHANVEIPVGVEMVRSAEHMQISDSVHEDEQNQQAS
mmetsp:Transcript_51482/g.112865  ORF Transcript_51482/g.112865 Transcript_51482/m.112865 type:complete len:219 (-) Transcript_51482:389-1045(-)